MLAIPFEVITWYGDNVFIGRLRTLCRHFGPLQLCPREVRYDSDRPGGYFICGRFAAPAGFLLERGRIVGRGATLSIESITSPAREKLIVHGPDSVWAVDPAAYKHIRAAIYYDTPRPKLSLAKFVGSNKVVRALPPGGCANAPYTPAQYLAFVCRDGGCPVFTYFTSYVSPDDPCWKMIGYVWHITPC